jgi:16S rRNA (cytosine1402-N4)-methyltransferase
MEQRTHIPVLLEEVLDFLNPARPGIYVDCTLGPGGHSLEILKNNTSAEVIGLDIDEKSLLLAENNLNKYAKQLTLIHTDFRYLPELQLSYSRVRGILIDLGISSFQLDSAERGFSYSLEGPLDMRMDLRNKLTASKIINKYSEHRLGQIFWENGELRQAKKLAREIVSRRKINKIETTTQLRRLVEEICRWRPQKGKIHPAAKVFLSLRIEINQELKDLSEFFHKLCPLLSRGARIVVISFHSLEDRIIKHTFRGLASPEYGAPSVKILTKKPVIPSEQETARNFRARSAKLRAAEIL